jgi:hypothetical protein
MTTNDSKNSENKDSPITEKSTEYSGIDYFKDNALTSKDEDEFQHKHYVLVLKDILLKSQTPINVGLYGKWGVGKSSIVHMLEEEIKNDKELKDFEYVEVDAWGISGKSLQQGILEEINAKLKFPFKQEQLEDKLYNVHQVDSVEFTKLIKSYGWIWVAIAGLSIPVILHAKDDILSALSVIGFASIIAVLVPLSRLFFSTSKRIIPRAVSTVQFNKIYDEIIKKRKKKLVVVIDNLDRCEDTVAVELLGIIQTFMVKDNCINILACDDEAIVTHLKNVKKNYSNKDGNEFLSKFFQVTIRIPPFIGENLSVYTEKLIKKRSVKFSPFVKPVLISGAIENPRKINQFLNIAVALYRLATFKEDAGRLQKGSITGNTNFLMKIIVIRHEWPEFYKALESNLNLLNNKEELEKWFLEQLIEDKNKEEINRLKRFLNSTKHSHANDIAPFLRLNQESYAAESGIGKFEDAFITLDPKAEEIFKELNNEKQEQYLSKIQDLMKKYESEPEKLTLVNCALSLIDILPHIDDIEIRTKAFAILGECMSSQLLEHWDKFDIEQLGLFGILEEMLDVFSKPFYNQLIIETFRQKTLNENLLEKFFKNGHIIKTDILDQIDSNFTKELSEHNYSNIEFITKYIKNYNWTENHITKPSHLISHIISRINFDETPETQTYVNIYENIKNSISDVENEIFYERILEELNSSVASNNPLPFQLLDYLKNIPMENFEIGSESKQKIFVSLCNSIEQNPDIGQCDEILKLIIPLYQKIEGLSNRVIISEKYLEDTFVHYAKRADANMLKNLTGILQSLNQYLNKENVIISILNRYVELGSNDPEIIRFLLKNTPYATEDVLIGKFEEMIVGREIPKFTTLLSTAKENNSEFNSDLIKKIGKICLQEAKDEENSIRYSMYEYALELNPDSYDKTKISDYAITLIEDEIPKIQDQGFSLLRKINLKYADRMEPIGVTKAIEIATNFVNNNIERAIPYLAFIFEYKDRFGYLQKRNLISLFRAGLKSDGPENIINNLIAYVKQLPTEIIDELFDELVEFAEKTPHGNAKEQCKQLLISLKEKLGRRQKEQMKRIFGATVLD